MIAPISAFDFDVIQAVMRQIAASGSTAPDTLRQLARTVAEEYCPDEVYPDEMIDSLVQAALAAAEKSRLPE
ncbi:hypothetical protein FHS67_001398 [Aminobacter aminovorans]|jgi:hypothetical protein|uniref:Uncharacterized protein n=1 Tax=Aminobacter aminovorans TaxID=83263 RepID=A0AAC8YWI1_AMIAI|nr:hypothetical protein AA2016_6256 [Aminobacter aminovorans]MBB3705088.1 hypothetical protein [Aminobacter aminovorans]